MNHGSALRRALALFATLFLTEAAHAQLFRAYLDPSGNDGNPCTLIAPCRLLPAALAAVASGGEIWLLDSANYNTGPVNVNKSVTILAIPGAIGSFVALGGNAIDITTPGVKVAMRNLVIVPFPGGGGLNGISMTAGTGLDVENCLIAGLPQAGIVVGANASLRVTDTTIRDNVTFGVVVMGGAKATLTRATIGGNIDTGVWALGDVAGTVTTADIIDSTIGGGGFGVTALSNNATAVVKVSVRGSQVVRNANFGVAAQSNAGAAVTLSVSGNLVANNGAGIAGFNAGTIILASGNTVTNNATGLQNSAAVFRTAGNNAVRNNTTETSGALTFVSPL